MMMITMTKKPPMMFGRGDRRHPFFFFFFFFFFFTSKSFTFKSDDQLDETFVVAVLMRFFSRSVLESKPVTPPKQKRKGKP